MGTFLLYTFIPFIFIDIFTMRIAVRKKIDTQNKYYKFHQNYGIRRTSIIKFLIGCIAYAGLTGFPPMNKVYFTVSLCFLYMACNFIIITISIATSPINPIPSNHLEENPLDSFEGFLVYPFEYLDTKKQFHTKHQETVRWSWKAFIIPEYWYFSNEILGAGYVSIALLFVYFSLSFVLSLKAVFMVILLVRIVSGCLGQRLYFAMYGKYA